ncbi:MAG TPA: nucleotide exchange factor GrpE [Kofleriaceae bacterium]|nr:nucleotide exchange factor GrpE [Kofleriaceae bacterium]
MSEKEEFDAVAAAKELDDLLGDTGSEGTADADYVADLEADIEALNALLAKKDAELNAANQRADQAHADIEAAGKRMAAASEKELEQRSRKMLESFLSVVDDLDRAITAAKTHATAAADLIEGIELVRRNMLARMGQFGVTHVPAMGEPFDPKRHDAVALVPVKDSAQDGRVIDVMREGYLVGDDTLRPASVAVGKLSK